MQYFLETTHLSEIIETSQKTKVVIFKYSNQCGSSQRIKKEFEEKILNKDINIPVFLVTVQTHRNLSKMIEENFKVKHESPQIITIEKGKYLEHKNHTNIKIQELIKNEII